ncbi:metallophosphoesterase [Abyssalbus ytuae]|uniref:Metallophosphoesterase n=1 Tax=Abyssalbus ytuae TaxID=2926907 RepID=A0A9E7D1C7_9FLAO|nr:metallophosphoesterase [Abyssalbus ytuae]UOB19210.1 metallophosphoesterase [Abyssalbus ytuae]
MNRRTLVIGDIHGALKALEQVLERAKVSGDDLIIFLGDYVDGWSQSPEVINFLIEFKTSYNCVFIRGNHDELCLDWLKNNTQNENWLVHGGQATVNAYAEVPENIRKIHINFIESLDDYYLDHKNRLFLHAGFTNIKGVESEYFSKMFYWDRSLWEMALALNPNLHIEDDLYPSRLKLYNEIYIGHTPTVRIGKTVPVNAANVWNVDTGAAYKSPLTILDIDTKKYWQSDNVNLLYLGEKGRN